MIQTQPKKYEKSYNSCTMRKNEYFHALYLGKIIFSRPIVFFCCFYVLEICCSKAIAIHEKPIEKITINLNYSYVEIEQNYSNEYNQNKNENMQLYNMNFSTNLFHEVGKTLQENQNGISNLPNVSGKYIGARCDSACDNELQHVICDVITEKCRCEANYPVLIDLEIGCGKPKTLGEQCFYHQTCRYNDEKSLCVQVNHNAICQCADGFHSVSYSKPFKRIFCTQDIAVLASNLPTLIGVSSGIAVLAGLICMVLHLFSKTKYPRHRNFGDANISPQIMYSHTAEIPLTIHSGRPSSQSSMRSSGSSGSFDNRRLSSTQHTNSKGILVSTSRTDSRRPSLTSAQSTSSSLKSYSMLRFEKEIQQKEIRREMKHKLGRLEQEENKFKPTRKESLLSNINIESTITLSLKSSKSAEERITVPGQVQET